MLTMDSVSRSVDNVSGHAIRFIITAENTAESYEMLARRALSVLGILTPVVVSTCALCVAFQMATCIVLTRRLRAIPPKSEHFDSIASPA